ncbi:polysaccharide biosynthesis protein [Sulfitobacter sabulilitoris]|uniref:Polysaccharide biosynthesis protein n=3 Tax=Sulfitobacter sabulilitoris TaxID=2562655 RepID=A0A5S3P7J3_9RHOB|nr:polysaccharide biosynthesis protein [Sulfitobacter sabulilitoris]
MARVARSSSFIILGYGGSQAMRLAANLILTRLLFPEAFGLMALITVVTVGLAMFSDVGIGPSIAQSRRGDDQAFLDTAWTVQVMRGFALWAVACLAAYPVAQFYGDAALMTYLPLAGAALAVAGFNPTRIETAHRHLLMGRLTLLDLAAQALGIASMIALAMVLQSVAALVIGGVLQALAKLVLTHLFLPGPANRFHWERAALRELVGFGKWIFLSTALWFVASQGDRAILGKFLTLEWLGVYNIGYFLASFPMLLGSAVSGRIFLPVYRETGAATGDAGSRKLRVLRFGLTGAVLVLLAVMALAGPALVGVLYDARYAAAGAMVVLIACMLMPQVIGLSYDQAALAAGDSWRFFIFCALRAVAQVSCLLVGAVQYGLMGAILGMGVAGVIVHPALVWLARRHRVWDPLHDGVYAALALVFGGGAVWLNWAAVIAMAEIVTG